MRFRASPPCRKRHVRSRSTASRRVLPDLKAGVREAAMAMVSPVRGFLPSRGGRSRVEKVPNPAMATVSPQARASAMVANTARTASAATDFDSDVPAATFETSSDRFMT